MDYKVPAREFINKDTGTGRIPILPNYVGNIGMKPVYDMDGSLESMDDILICTERGVREVATKKWGKLKGYPVAWGTTAEDRRWIIGEPSLYFWCVLVDAFSPTLTHKEEECFFVRM
jgi:hypothetical protein